MHTKFRARYYTHKLLLQLLGPAQLGESSDPMRRLERQWEERFGPRVKEFKTHVPKRRFQPHLYETTR